MEHNMLNSQLEIINKIIAEDITHYLKLLKIKDDENILDFNQKFSFLYSKLPENYANQITTTDYLNSLENIKELWDNFECATIPLRKAIPYIQMFILARINSMIKCTNLNVGNNYDSTRPFNKENKLTYSILCKMLKDDKDQKTSQQEINENNNSEDNVNKNIDKEINENNNKISNDNTKENIKVINVRTCKKVNFIKNNKTKCKIEKSKAEIKLQTSRDKNLKSMRKNRELTKINGKENNEYNKIIPCGKPLKYIKNKCINYFQCQFKIAYVNISTFKNECFSRYRLSFFKNLYIK